MAEDIEGEGGVDAYHHGFGFERETGSDYSLEEDSAYENTDYEGETEEPEYYHGEGLGIEDQTMMDEGLENITFNEVGVVGGSKPKNKIVSVRNIMHRGQGSLAPEFDTSGSIQSYTGKAVVSSFDEKEYLPKLDNVLHRKEKIIGKKGKFNSKTGRKTLTLPSKTYSVAMTDIDNTADASVTGSVFVKNGLFSASMIEESLSTMSGIELNRAVEQIDSAMPTIRREDVKEDVLNSQAVLEDWLTKSLTKPELKSFLSSLANPVGFNNKYMEHLSGLDIDDRLDRESSASKLFASPIAWSNALFEGVEVSPETDTENAVFQLQRTYTGSNKNKSSNQLGWWAKDMIDRHIPAGVENTYTKDSMRTIVAMGGSGLQRKLETNHNTTFDKIGKYTDPTRINRIQNNLDFLSEFYVDPKVTNTDALGYAKAINERAFIKHLTQTRLPGRKVLDMQTGQQKLDDKGMPMFTTQILPYPNQMGNMSNIVTHNELPDAAGFQAYQGVMKQQSEIDLEMEGKEFWNTRSLTYRQANTTSMNKTLGIAAKKMNGVMPDGSPITVAGLNKLGRSLRDDLQKELLTNQDIEFGRSKTSVNAQTKDDSYSPIQEARQESASFGLSMDGYDQSDLNALFYKPDVEEKARFLELEKTINLIEGGGEHEDSDILQSLIQERKALSIKINPNVGFSTKGGIGSSATQGIHDSSNKGLSDSELYVQYRTADGMSKQAAYNMVMGIEDPNVDRMELDQITDRVLYNENVLAEKAKGNLPDQGTVPWAKSRMGNTSATTWDKSKTSTGRWSDAKMKKEALNLAMQRAGVGADEFIGNAIMGSGSQHEKDVKKLFQLKTGYEVEEAFWTQKKGHKNSGASPDGFVFDKDGNKMGLLEIKVHSSEEAYLGGKDKYNDQMQWQMYITGEDQTFFANMYKYDQNSMFYDVVSRDEDRIAELIDMDYDYQRMINEYEEGEEIGMISRPGHKNQANNRKELRERNETKKEVDKAFSPANGSSSEDAPAKVFGKVDSSRSAHERFSNNPAGDSVNTTSDGINPDATSIKESVKTKSEKEKITDMKQNKAMKDLEKSLIKLEKATVQQTKSYDRSVAADGGATILGGITGTNSRRVGAGVAKAASMIYDGTKTQMVDIKLEQLSGDNFSKIRNSRNNLSRFGLTQKETADGTEAFAKFSNETSRTDNVTSYTNMMKTLGAGEVSLDGLGHADYANKTALEKQSIFSEKYSQAHSSGDRKAMTALKNAVPSMGHVYQAIESGMDWKQHASIEASANHKELREEAITSGRVSEAVARGASETVEWVTNRATGLGDAVLPAAAQEVMGGTASLATGLGLGAAAVGGVYNRYQTLKGGAGAAAEVLRNDTAAMEDAIADVDKKEKDAGKSRSKKPRPKGRPKVPRSKWSKLAPKAARLLPKLGVAAAGVAAVVASPAVVTGLAVASVGMLAYDVYDTFTEDDSEGVDPSETGETNARPIKSNSMSAGQYSAIEQKKMELGAVSSGGKEDGTTLKVEVVLDDSVVIVGTEDEFGNSLVETTPYHKR